MSALLSILFLACAVVCFLHIRCLLRDKTVKGVCLIPSYVFITTNAFEVLYFGRLHDWLPVIGAGLMCIANIVWLVLALYYSTGDWIEESFSDFSLDYPC